MIPLKCLDSMYTVTIGDEGYQLQFTNRRDAIEYLRLCRDLAGEVRDAAGKLLAVRPSYLVR